MLATLAAALCMAQPVLPGAVTWSTAPPWLAAIPFPPTEQASVLALGQELLNLEVTPEKPGWFRFVPAETGPVVARYATLEGGRPRVLVLDSLGVPIAGSPEVAGARTAVVAHCGGGASYYVAVLGLAGRAMGNLLLAPAGAAAKDAPGASATDEGATDFSLRLDSFDPSCVRLPLRPGRPTDITIDLGGALADTAITGPAGEVLLDRPADFAPIRATLAPVLPGRYLLTCVPVLVPSERNAVRVAAGPPSPAVPVAKPEEPLRLRFERRGDVQTAVVLLDSGQWQVVLSGDQYQDAFGLAVHLGGATEGLFAKKETGQASTTLGFLVTEPCTALLAIEYLQGPGSAPCEVRLARDAVPAQEGPVSPAGELQPGWSRLQCRDGAIYMVRPIGEGSSPDGLWFVEPKTGYWRTACALPQAGAALIWRPFEGVVVSVCLSSASRARVALAECVAPAAADLPADASRAALLRTDGMPTTVQFTPQCPRAWLRLEATAGTRYELRSEEQVGCDADLVVLPSEAAQAIWSDGEMPDTLGSWSAWRLTWTSPETRAYFVRVMSHLPLTSPLAWLSLTARAAATGRPAPQPCAVGDSTHEAPRVPSGTPIYGSIAAWHAGYLRLTVPAAKLLSLDPAETAFVNSAIRFVDEAGLPAGADEYAKSQAADVLPLQAEQDTEVFLEIVDWSDAPGHFQLCLTLADTPKP